MRSWQSWLVRAGAVGTLSVSMAPGARAFDYRIAVDMVQAYFAPHTRILHTSNPKWGLSEKIDGLPKGWLPIEIVWADGSIWFGETKAKGRSAPLLSVDPKSCVARDQIDRAAGTLTCPLVLTW